MRQENLVEHKFVKMLPVIDDDENRIVNPAVNNKEGITLKRNFSVLNIVNVQTPVKN